MSYATCRELSLIVSRADELRARNGDGPSSGSPTRTALYTAFAVGAPLGTALYATFEFAAIALATMLSSGWNRSATNIWR